MLTDEKIEQILQRIPSLRVGVLGDLFLDRYLDLDATLTEPSIETGLDAYQVVNVRSYPGAAGTVINNLAALGVGNILPIAVIGDDGEGYELRQALQRLPAVDQLSIFLDGSRRTPTYCKPMLGRPGETPRELNRLDFKNRTPLPAESEKFVLDALEYAWPRIDALLVLDQVSEPECGVVTTRVRRQVEGLARTKPSRIVLADSRERVGLFRSIMLKPNERECRTAVGGVVGRSPEEDAGELARRCGRTVFCTCGADGILVADGERGVRVPGYPVIGPIDIVGAGDSTSAGILCALTTGATAEDAAAFGNLVASITIQQLGTTGTASPEQVRQRWHEVSV